VTESVFLYVLAGFLAGMVCQGAAVYVASCFIGPFLTARPKPMGKPKPEPGWLDSKEFADADSDEEPPEFEDLIDEPGEDWRDSDSFRGLVGISSPSDGPPPVLLRPIDFNWLRRKFPLWEGEIEGLREKFKDRRRWQYASASVLEYMVGSNDVAGHLLEQMVDRGMLERVRLAEDPYEEVLLSVVLAEGQDTPASVWSRDLTRIYSGDRLQWIPGYRWLDRDPPEGGLDPIDFDALEESYPLARPMIEQMRAWRIFQKPGFATVSSLEREILHPRGGPFLLLHMTDAGMLEEGLIYLNGDGESSDEFFSEFDSKPSSVRIGGKLSPMGDLKSVRAYRWIGVKS
jgi:hypothetical protein